MAERIVRQAAKYVEPDPAGVDRPERRLRSRRWSTTSPRASDEDRARVAELQPGSPTPGLVVTEPLAEWVLAGEFKTDRPAWETMGAKFVEPISPHEMRKLYLSTGRTP